MARYKNGSIRPSQSESISDQLRGVRTGYLMDGGVPVTGDYMDAIQRSLHAGFGPPPTPSVGYAATASYEYPSQKMVTGAALASAQMRAALAQGSYSSPAGEYHRGLRALRGLGASAATFTITTGMNATQALQAMNAACGGPMGLDDLLAATGAANDRSIKAGTYSCPVSGDSATGADDTGPGTSTASSGALPEEVAEAIDSNVGADVTPGYSFSNERIIAAETARAQKAELERDEKDALAAFVTAPENTKAEYVACIKDESNDIVTDFSNCRGILGLGGPSGWETLLADLNAVGNGLLGAAAGTGKTAIEAGLAKLQAAGKPLPEPCKTDRYSGACAGAVAVLLGELDKGQQQVNYTGTGAGAGAGDNTALYIGLGVGAVVLIGVVALLMSKKPSAA